MEAWVFSKSKKMIPCTPWPTRPGSFSMGPPTSHSLQITTDTSALQCSGMNIVSESMPLTESYYISLLTANHLPCWGQINLLLYWLFISNWSPSKQKSNKNKLLTVMSDQYCCMYNRAAQILGIFFASNSIIEFDPNSDSIPIFGSLGRHFTTTRELRSRPFWG